MSRKFVFLVGPFRGYTEQENLIIVRADAENFFSKFSIKLSTSENNIFKGTIEEML